jgi:hypothetical protein
VARTSVDGTADATSQDKDGGNSSRFRTLSSQGLVQGVEPDRRRTLFDRCIAKPHSKSPVICAGLHDLGLEALNSASLMVPLARKPASCSTVDG